MSTNDETPPDLNADSASQTSAANGGRPYRRKLRNMVLAPKSQFRTAAMIFFVGFIFISVLFAYLLTKLNELVQTLASTSVDSQQASAITSNTGVMLMSMYFFLILTFLLTAIFLALSITHRYLGPMVPIQRHVKALLNGDFSSRIALRKGDQFQELAADLNQLCEKMRESNANRPS